MPIIIYTCYNILHSTKPTTHLETYETVKVMYFSHFALLKCQQSQSELRVHPWTELTFFLISSDWTKAARSKKETLPRHLSHGP